MGWRVILRHTEWHAFGGTHMHVVRDGTSNYTEWHVLKMTRAGSFHRVLQERRITNEFFLKKVAISQKLASKPALVS